MRSALALVIASIAGAATACDGLNGYGYGYGALYNALDYRVPYFAAHPPVYYSYPVPRTYGYSPFAYPPEVMTPDVAPAAPLEIVNPFVPSSTSENKTKAPQDQAVENRAAEAPKPVVVMNPFVEPGVRFAAWQK